MSRTAVIVIDMLNDFVTGPIASPRIHHIIEPIKDLCDYARKHDMPVIYPTTAIPRWIRIQGGSPRGRRHQRRRSH